MNLGPERARAVAAYDPGGDLAAVHRRMAAAVAAPSGPADPLYGWLRYHFGWADAQGQATDARTAKGVRPRLCLHACYALGGDPAVAVPAAACVEMTHEFSLIHDDIEDRDRHRRGRPAVWTLVGAPQAINLGDALFGLARLELGQSDVAAPVRLEMNARYDRACVALAEGQYMDLSFEGRGGISRDMYLAMVERKTGALLGLAAALGALAAGADDAAANAMDTFGRAVGVAFQIADDVLGIWGDPNVTGKPAGADLLRGKRSYPVLLAFEEPTLAPRMRAVLDGAVDPDVVSELADAMDAAGVRSASLAAARRQTAVAREALSRLALVPAGEAELVALARRAAERQR